MPAPTLVVTEAAWTTGTSPKTVTFTAAVGDWLFVLAGGDAYEGGGNPVTAASVATTSGSTTAWIDSVKQLASPDADWIMVSRAQVTAAGSVTVQVARTQTGVSNEWGFYVVQATGSAGIGSFASSLTPSATQAVSLTVSQDSAVATLALDWDAAAAGSAWVPATGATTVERALGGTTYTIAAAYWNAQAAGTRSYGASGMVGNNIRAVAVEILGSSAASLNGYILLEDGSKLLLEDGSGALVGEGFTGPALTSVTSTRAASWATRTPVTASTRAVSWATRTSVTASTRTASWNVLAVTFPFSTIVDSFDDGVVAAPPGGLTYGTITEPGGRLRATSAVDTVSGWVTDDIYDLRESSVSVQMFRPNPGGTTEFVLHALNSGGTRTLLQLSSTGLLVASVQDGYAETGVEGGAQSVTVPDGTYARYRMAAGTLFFEYHNGASWTTLRTVVAPPAWLNSGSLQVTLQASGYGSAATMFAEFDNLNIAPPVSVTSTRTASWSALASTAASSRSTTWETRARATATRAATWATLAAASSTRAATWAALSRASSSRLTLWAALTSAASQRALSWATLAAASSARATTWVASATVASTRGTTWAVTGTAVPVTSTRGTSWATVALASSTRAASWSVASRATSVRGVSWSVLTPVASTRAASWATLLTAASSRAASWTTAATAASTRSAAWAALSRASSSRPTNWATTALATAQRAVSWQTSGLVASPRPTSWTTYALTTAARSASWTTISRVTSTRAASWNTDANGQVSSARSTTWVALARVTSSRGTTWATAGTIAQVSSTRATTWTSRASVASARATTWPVRSLASSSRAAAWATAARVSGARQTAWATLTPATATRPAVWSVLTATESARLATWATRSQVGSQRQATWATQRRVTEQRITFWEIRDTQSVASARGSSWSTLATATSSRSVRWRVAVLVAQHTYPTTGAATVRPTAPDTKRPTPVGTFRPAGTELARPTGVTYRS